MRFSLDFFISAVLTRCIRFIQRCSSQFRGRRHTPRPLSRQNVLMRKCVSEFVNALVIIHEVPPWCAVCLADWDAVCSADNYRRTIAEETISLNVGMRFKNV